MLDLAGSRWLDRPALPCLLSPWRSPAFPNKLSASDDHRQQMSVSVVACSAARDLERPPQEMRVALRRAEY
jgi:hypothetical protein